MAIVNLNIIKNWFLTGLKPTQVQFWDTWDSFRHKNDSVPVADILGLDSLLLAKASQSVVDDLFAKTKIYVVGELQVFKVAPNANEKELEINDWCIGFVEGQMISANYLGGDRLLLTSFNI